MPTHKVEFRLKRSTSATQPYFVEAFDVSTSPERKLAYSETYTTAEAAKSMVLAVQAGRCTFEVYLGNDKKWYWHVKSTNRVDILLRSARYYDTSVAADERATFLRINAAGALLVGWS